MTDRPKPPARRPHPVLALLMGVAGLGLTGLASALFLEALDAFATAPWLALLSRLGLALVLFGLGFWVFVRGAAAFLGSPPPDH